MESLDPENMAMEDEYANENGGTDEYGSNADQPEEYRDDAISPSNGVESTQMNERRQSGRQVIRRNYALDTNGEYLSESDDGHVTNAANLTSAAPLSYAGSLIIKAEEPLKKYFMERLFQVIYLLGGTEELMRGWLVHVLPNERGLLSGILDVIYVSNRGRRYRNRVDVACSLGLMQTPKNTKSMSREQMYLTAMEMREKHLISQLIGAADGNCDEVQYINDNAKVMFEDKQIGNVYDPSALTDSSDVASKIEDNVFFSFGNVTVLNWGNIIPDLAFHTTTQIYPMGFKCIRQEHDVTLDKIVECLCEIDSIEEENPTTKSKVMIPLFRLSVAWVVASGEKRIRVYEARSPQQAWQAAMLETEGIENNIKVETSKSGDLSTSALTVDEFQFESMDDEEIMLRNRICEERRKYFRALRQEQKQGLQAAVVPRLALENVESFADEGIMRLIEGMQGALDCINYTFVDSREQEGGRRNIWRGYGTINDKLKSLYKVYKKSSTPYDLLMNVGNLYGSNGSNMKRKASNSLLPLAGDSTNPSTTNDALAQNIDARKRIRQDIRDHRLHASSIHKTRNIYVKRVENTVSNLKNNFMKQIRKRREELKYIIGGISDQEYQVSRNIHIENMTSEGLVGRIIGTSHLLNDESESAGVEDGANHNSSTNEEATSIPLPEPGIGMILFDGNIFGNVLEMWDYLQTFSGVFDLGRELGYEETEQCHPEFFQLCNALKHFDPHFQRLMKLSSPFKSSFDAISNQYPTPAGSKLEAFEMSTESAEKLVNAIGIALTRTLLHDYEHIMGVEAAKESIGNYKIIVNSLTWREIARVVLISACGRDLGVTEMDMISGLKGRGYYCTPETADKKALRLCRRRILNQYYLRHELQESIYGFQAGICVRVPTPSFYNRLANSRIPLWGQLIHEIQSLPDNYGWLMYDMVYVAAMMCEDEQLKPTFRAVLSSQIDSNSISHVRSELLDMLEQHYPKYRNHHQIVYAEEVAPYQWPTPAWEVFRQHFAYQYLFAKSDYLQILNSDANIGTEEDMEEEELGRASDDEEDDAVEDNGGEDMARRSSSAITVPESADENIATEDDEINVRNDFPLGQTTVTDQGANVLHPSVEATVIRRNIPGRFVSKATASASSKLPPEIISALEYDPLEYDKLSVAMKRCHIVLYELIRHHLAQPFVVPVDRKVVLGYYNFISQPISLQEIKQSLLKGVYEDQIYRVYSDVMILFENSVAFNPDSSPIHQSALKLVVIFERLFYEIVLSWDQSLDSNSCCHICRQQQHSSQSSQSPVFSDADSGESVAHRITSCERCEACYHFGCLDPPVTSTLRTDWYCMGCVESRSIANVHPNKFTKVYHPHYRKVKGQVVGIEQIRQTLQFVIDFDDRSREVWDGQKVRQFAVSPDDPEFGVPVLPSGYSYDDYDRVCGLARGYSGWGSFHSLFPAFLSDSHSFYARRRSLIDPFFHKSRLAIAWLGSASLCPEDLGIHEIVTIFRAIAQRAMSSSALVHALSKQDESNGEALAICGENIMKGNIGYEKLIRKLCIEMEEDQSANATNMVTDETAGIDADFDAEDEEWIERVANMDSSASNATGKTAVSESKEKEPTDKLVENDRSMDVDDNEDMEADDENLNSKECDIDLARWEHRRLSRRRGREDALASHALLSEIIRDVDIDGSQELEEIGPVIRQVAGEFYNSAMSAIVKVCTVKPHDDSDFEEWCRGYQSKTTQFQNIDYENPILCGYCGQDEFSVSSIFVYGQTYEEFLNERDDVNNQRKKRIDLDINSSLRTHKRRGRYARLHVARSMLWKPCYEPDALIEAKECELIHHEFMEGSLPVHECCAEMMTTYREELLQRSQRTDNHRVTDVIAGIGRGKTTSIGRDRDGNTYWVFCGLPGVFVCSESKGLDIPQAANSAAMDMMVATNPKLLHSISTNLYNSDAHDATASNSLITVDHLRNRTKNIWEYYTTDFRFYPDGETMLASGASMASGNANSNKKTMWRLYRQDSDIRSLLLRLDKKHLQERTLAQAISLLFPAAMINPLLVKNISLPALENSGISSAESKEETHLDEVDDAMVVNDVTAAQEEQHEKVVSGEAMDIDQDVIEENSASSEYIVDNSDDDEDAVIEFKVSEKRRGRPPKSLSSANNQTTSSSASSELFRQNSYFRYVSDEASGILTSSQPQSSRLYQIGDEVLVDGMTKHGLLWNAKIIDIRSSNADEKEKPGCYYYKVSYNHWDDGYDGWIPEANIRFLVSSSGVSNMELVDSDEEEEDFTTDPAIQRKNQQYLSTSRQLYLQRQIAQANPLLRSLRAYVYLRAPHRESASRPLIHFSSTMTTVETLRIALLMIERALPVGSIDDSEDRWGDDFAIAWREAVAQANDAITLMQVMIMLEYGIRTAWLIPAGLKLMSCLPSRIHCLRNATIGLVAMKVWSLDQSIRYDKINYPKGHASAIHNTTTTSSKSKSSSSSALSSSSSASYLNTGVNYKVINK